MEDWNNFLQQGETIEKTFSISNLYRKFGLIFWTVISLLFLFCYGIGILIFLFALFYFGYYLKVANNYAITNKRVLIRKGWIHKNTIIVDFEKITDIQIREPFFDRIFIKSGNILINTAGTSNYEIILEHIDNPHSIKNIIKK